MKRIIYIFGLALGMTALTALSNTPAQAQQVHVNVSYSNYDNDRLCKPRPRYRWRQHRHHARYHHRGYRRYGHYKEVRHYGPRYKVVERYYAGRPHYRYHRW